MRAQHFWNSICDGLYPASYPTEIYRRILSCSYPYTDVTILCKNPTKAIMYVYTTLFTLLHSYMFQPSKGPSSGSTDTFHEPGQQSTCPDVNIRLKEQCVVCSRTMVGHMAVLKWIASDGIIANWLQIRPLRM